MDTKKTNRMKELLLYIEFYNDNISTAQSMICDGDINSTYWTFAKGALSKLKGKIFKLKNDNDKVLHINYSLIQDGLKRYVEEQQKGLSATIKEFEAIK